MPSYADLRQRHVHTLLERVPLHLERLSWTAEHLAAWQHQQLRELVAHAVANSPWHRERLEGLRSAPLDALPTMSKSDVVANFDGLVTDPRLSRSVVEAHLARLDDGDAYLFDEYHVVATGGSSGGRTLVVWDWVGWADCFAGLARRSFARTSPGDTPVMASVVGDHASHMGAAFMETFSSPTITMHRVSATLPIEDIVSRLDTIQPTTLQGYPTMLHRLALEQRAGRLHIAPLNVFSSSETLTPETITLLEETFGVPVENSYAASEAGGLATSCGQGPWMHTNEDLHIMEVLDDRVLVTNLSNRVMPLIRYELDDRIVLDDVACPCGTEHRTVRRVDGRSSEIFRLGDADVHPVVFTTVLGRNRSVADYQVRQRGGVLEVDLVVDGTVDESALADELGTAVRVAGGEAKVCLRTVTEVPRHPVTGKASRFVADR